MVAKLVHRLENRRPGSALDADLRFFDSAGDPLGSATILECLTAEVHDGHRVYVVDRSFIERVDAAMQNVKVSDLVMPCYDGGTEPAYIEQLRTGHAHEFAVIDRAFLHIEGEASVEACDAVSRSGGLIHLKRKGRSSLFSHLCFQASSSCALLKGHQAAYEFLRASVESNSWAFSRGRSS